MKKSALKEKAKIIKESSIVKNVNSMKSISQSLNENSTIQAQEQDERICKLEREVELLKIENLGIKSRLEG